MANHSPASLHLNHSLVRSTSPDVALVDPAARSAPVQSSASSVHVWILDLDHPFAEFSNLEQTLAPEERARARRLRFPRDRHRYITARGALRTILGAYLGIDAKVLRLGVERFGKPCVQSGFGVKPVHFNVAHSQHLFVCAVCGTAEVGIDVEWVSYIPEMEAIAEAHFSPWEYATLLSVPEAQRAQAFFRCWTRKEAFVKAVGEGLSYPLHQFDVSLALDEPTRLLAIRPDPNAASSWSLHHLDPEPGSVGAIAVRSSAALIRHHRLPSP